MATCYDAGNQYLVKQQEQFKTETLRDAASHLGPLELDELELFVKQLDDDYESGETFHNYEIQE